MKPTWIPALRATFALTLVAACAACGGGGAGGYTPSAVSQSDRRELPQAFITRASVNYSPYRSSRNESELSRELITPANVLEDLRLVQATGIGTIRLFSSRAFAETVLKVIKDNQLDIKVQLGAYPNPVDNAAAEADNQAVWTTNPSLVDVATNHLILDITLLAARQGRDCAAVVAPMMMPHLNPAPADSPSPSAAQGSPG